MLPMDRPCTLTFWRVLPGREADFLDAARQLADVLRRLPGAPGELTLVQSVEDPAVFRPSAHRVVHPDASATSAGT
jgi:hypothetical protein